MNKPPYRSANQVTYSQGIAPFRFQYSTPKMKVNPRPLMNMDLDS